MDKEALARELGKVLGRRVICFRVGDYGFDLVFDDGRELEVYCGLESSLGCAWGIVVAERLLFPVASLDEAQKIVEELRFQHETIDVDIVESHEGRVYVSVARSDLPMLADVCKSSPLSERARRILCRD